MDYKLQSIHDFLSGITSRTDFSITTLLAYLIAAVFLIHQILHHFDLAAVLSIQDVLWNALVQLTPRSMILNEAQIQELGHNPTNSQVHAAKAENMRRVLGLSGHALLQQASATSLIRSMSMSSNTPPSIVKSNNPPGLGNWDNSCYQNSVLQGLASLTLLREYLDSWSSRSHTPANSTLEALEDTIVKLNSPTNNGKQLWTPAKLKSMSSWQQQDAQEYFSKIMDELDKDVSRTMRLQKQYAGLEQLVDGELVSAKKEQESAHNPLEGLLAQKVMCTSCGFTEGLSMIPFNCLTVPLGNENLYDLQDCLNEYTKLEPITDVECAKCTLRKAQNELQRRVQPSTSLESDDVASNKLSQLPPEVRQQIFDRLTVVDKALENDDFSDETLNQIAKKTRVSSTKTRQALIARPPQDLVIHVNRSVFDELTGMQRKNYAALRYPSILDFGEWVLGSKSSNSDKQIDTSLPREDLWKYLYRIKAIVTHYGRHENGHYIAYRQSQDVLDPDSKQHDAKSWYQLSDDDVSVMSEANVLNQGGVFMLFYERIEGDSTPAKENTEGMAIDDTAETNFEDATAAWSGESTSAVTGSAETDSIMSEHRAAEVSTLELAASADIEIQRATNDTVADESEAESIDHSIESSTMPKSQTPQLPLYQMRTANADRSNDEHWNVGRFIAAT